MVRRSMRRLGVALAVVVLAAGLGAPAARGVATTITILYAPANPLVANTSYGFTAKMEPAIAGATVTWTVSGAVVATDLTNPNGVSTVDLVFGPGGYGVQAVLEGADGYDWAWSETLQVLVDPDPTREPDAFSVSSWSRGTLAANGPEARVAFLEPGAWPANRVRVGGTRVDTGEQMGIGMIGPEGGPLVPGVYNPADRPRPTTDDAEVTVGGPWPGCGSGVSEGTFAVLSLERDPAGYPISITAVAEYRCPYEWWPTVAWIRYNDTTPIPSLTLPDASPVQPSVIEGEQGSPVTYPMTNDGEVPVSIGQVALGGVDASAYMLESDGCSGTTLAPGEGCSFDVVFAPATDGSKAATILIPSDLPVTPRKLPIVGQALVAETVTAPVVAPEEWYLEHGARYTAQVVPDPGINASECLVDGAHLDGSIVDEHGVVFCLGPRPAPGTHEVRIRYLGSYLHGEAISPVTSFTVDPATTTSLVADLPTAPANVPVTVTATVGFAGDLAYGGGSVTITDQATDEIVGEGTVGPSSPAFSVTTTFAPGEHHLVASYAGIDGIQAPSSGSTDLAIGAPDLVVPAISPPIARIQRTTLADGRIPVRLTWSGSDQGSGVDHYELRRRTGSGSWTIVAGSLHAPTRDVVLVPRRHYRFSVRAVDAAGNASAWTPTLSLEPRQVPEADPAVTLRGRWVGSTNDAWWGGQAVRSRQAGATATLAFTGRTVAWVAATGPNRGRARVYLDGVAVATVDLWSASRHPQQIVWTARWARADSHRVVIRVLGTNGRPRVDVDGFAILR